MHLLHPSFLLFVLSFTNTVSAQAAAPAMVPPERGQWVHVDKSDRLLRLMQDEKEVARLRIALGRQPVGQKRQEGDNRTPEGRYLLDYRNPNSGYFKSIHISYPTAEQRRQAKARSMDPGGLVMIHGQKNGFGGLAAITQRFDWTCGCIALDNTDMQTLWDALELPVPIRIDP